MSARRGALPVAQRMLVVVACASAFAAPKTPGAFGKTSDATKGIVAGLTTLVNLQGGVKETDLAPRAREFASLAPEQIRAGLAVDFGNEYLWSGKISPELYDEDCVFTDPTLSFSGLRTFEANLANLDFWIELLVPASRRRVDLYDLRVLENERAVVAKWRMLGNLRLPWAPTLDLNGTTRYTLDGVGGRISSYDETWAMSAGDALGQLLRPGAAVVAAAEAAEGPEPSSSEPDYWAGRKSGAPPPAPAVTFGAGAPTFVILPGFGNDKADYSTPFGLDEAVGGLEEELDGGAGLEAGEHRRGGQG